MAKQVVRLERGALKPQLASMRRDEYTTYTDNMPNKSSTNARPNARARTDQRHQHLAATATLEVHAAAADAELDPAVRELLDSFDLTDVVSHLLRRAHFLAEDLFAREFANEGLTPRQKAVLITLYQEPGL